jgi:hypothetical protein
MGWKVFCSRSIWPRSSCMKVTSQMPSSTSRRPTSRGAATRPRRSHQAEAQPPDGELGEVEQGIGAGEGHAVVGAYGGGQPTFAEQMLEGGNGWIFPHGLERLAEQQVARGAVGRRSPWRLPLRSTHLWLRFHAAKPAISVPSARSLCVRTPVGSSPRMNPATGCRRLPPPSPWAKLLWSSQKNEIKRPIRLLRVRLMIDISQEVVLKSRAGPG